MAARKKSRTPISSKPPSSSQPMRKGVGKSARKTIQKRVSKPTRTASSRASAAKNTPKKSRRVRPIPKGFHTVTASLCFEDTAFAMAFYERAFGAKELYRLSEPSGKIGHAEMQIGDSVVMMSDEYPEIAVLSAKTMGGSPIRLSIVTQNPDAMIGRAVSAGATIVRPMHDEFYGWRSGVVMDPFGYCWFITCQIESVSPREMQARWNKLLVAHRPESAA